MNQTERERLLAEIAALREPMLRKTFYAILWTKTDTNPDALLPGLPEHLRFMLDLEERGVLVSSGPLFEEDGSASLHGLSIVRAASYDEARAVAASEPYVRKGIRSFQLWGWELNEGRIDISVRLGTGTYEFR